jgi:peptidoglycan/LPS O-acetylase OafA/YrhL
MGRRLAWLEGIRLFAAVILLIYHAQLLFTDYAYTPQPTGLLENLYLMGDVTARIAGNGTLGYWSAMPMWFGFQFVDVFVLVSGFSLVLSMKGASMRAGEFVLGRCLRILLPFWTVAAIGYPVLWVLGTLTKSYVPDAWHMFAGLTFPLLFDYGGRLLVATSGPWWFVPLILSFAVAFPGLWWLLERWGSRNLLILTSVVTLGYRLLAVYVFDGHPTYTIVAASASWFPFLSMLAKLSTFVLGMVVARQFQAGRGPIFWSTAFALKIGLVTYGVGFVAQFYRVGWIVNDGLIAIGLTLLCMVVFRWICTLAWLSRLCVVLGAHSYSYFLVHNFVIDRTIRLVVQGRLELYHQALPLMLVGTFGLALVVDACAVWVRGGAIALFRQMDERLCLPGLGSIGGSSVKRVMTDRSKR